MFWSYYLIHDFLVANRHLFLWNLITLCTRRILHYYQIQSYIRLIGKLLYLRTTRPDIAFVVGKLCQFSSSLLEIHLQAAHKVLRYLKGTIGKGLFYSSDSSNLTLKGYTDSDWNSCPDTRRSVTAFCMYIGDSLVSWKSKKQDNVSSSSAEAEYKAMACGTKELFWIAKVMKEFHLPTFALAIL